MEPTPHHGYRKLPAPFDGFDEAGAKIFLEPAGQFL
jgi:hypothetical protein